MPTLKAGLGIVISSSSIYGNKWVRRMSGFTPTSSRTQSANFGGGGMARARPLISSSAFWGIRKATEERILEGWRLISFAGISALAPAQGRSSRRRRVAAFGTVSGGGEVGSSRQGRGGLMGSEQIKNDQEEEERHRYHNPPQHAIPPSTRVITLPTVLTLGRVAAVPLLITIFYLEGWWATTATTTIFIAAAVTDWLDGYLARKMRLGTPFGAFLDPVADKLMVAATLVLLCTKPPEVTTLGQVSWLLTVPAIAIIGREITMSAVREWAASQNAKLLEAVAVNSLGKWKTATQMTALTILLATRDNSLAGSSVLVASGVVLLYISAGLAVCSLAVYMKKIWRVLLK
ncbi:CDP-diacylglycerol--glycerol-3-phosphate 3-phosphatidyltransferase 2-like [Aristolochia californica]|uniref:CDP-diacylglycerol--glycerol-3-phosphate 3-phosphatidyltransferase 2-like n=1 Tax=Aristolochia californica TaxID=171875 RepID=UPI0035E0FC75